MKFCGTLNNARRFNRCARLKITALHSSKFYNAKMNTSRFSLHFYWKEWRILFNVISRQVTHTKPALDKTQLLFSRQHETKKTLPLYRNTILTVTTNLSSSFSFLSTKKIALNKGYRGETSEHYYLT